MSTPLYTFGIITDTHVRAISGDRSSPFPVNELANERADYAARLLALHNPAFTIHLGDMVHPLPHMNVYDDACVEAKRLLAPLSNNIHYVPGNHDIGDKPMPASPAVGINEQAEHAYTRHFGAMWYRIDYEPLTLLVINSSLVNSATEKESEQRLWLEQQLAELSARKQRTILFSHYPPFIHDANEAEHYDNYAQPGRNWLLNLLDQHHVEAVFSGHVHHYFYNRHSETDLYCLPSTSFTRQDYAEMYRCPSSEEFGRDDFGKLHVCLIDVFENTIKARLLPTFGRGTNASPEHFTAPLPVKAAVHLRHAWYETIDLPYNGPMEEFSRKRTHNDYTLLRLQQLGIGNVRVPFNDIVNTDIRERLSAYCEAGVRFHAFFLVNEDLSGSIIESMSAPHKPASLELVFPGIPEINEFESLVKQLQTVADNGITLPPIFVNMAHTSSHEVTSNSSSSSGNDKVYAHTVVSGFPIKIAENVLKNIAQANRITENIHISGPVVRIPWEVDLLSSLLTVQSELLKADNHSLTALALICFAPANPAHSNFDNQAISERLIQALNSSASMSKLELQFDTFMDIDRGYSPRNGLVDRYLNFREAAFALLNTKQPP